MIWIFLKYFYDLIIRCIFEIKWVFKNEFVIDGFIFNRFECSIVVYYVKRIYK